MSATATTTVDETDYSVKASSNGGVAAEFSKQSNNNNNSSSSSSRSGGVISVGEVLTDEIEMKSNQNSESIGKSDAQKTNWVKFDDDEDSDAVAAKKPPIAISNIAKSKTTTAATATTTPTTTATATTAESQQNVAAISIVPPPPVQQNNKPTTPTPSDVTPAVLATESIHINLNTAVVSPQKSNGPSTNSSTTPNDVPKNTSVTISTAAPMRTIELSTGRMREGFANGDVIVTLLPTNTRWPWITPAVFRPELVPEELMAQGLTLTVEEYVNAMETLVNDYRFTVYNVCYKRVLVCWILFAFCVLLTLLFSGLQGIALFSLGVGWLFLNAAAIFLCMWIKLRLSRGLEKCLARVNKQLVRHKILLVLDDRGRISCHKVNLCFLYFDPSQCVAYLNEYIERSEQNGSNIQSGWEAKLDLDVNDIVIQGSNPMRLSRKQERAALLYLRYASRWGNEMVRGLGDVSVTEPARHCAKHICACQYIERHISCKPRGKSKLNIIYWVLASERYEN